MRCTVAIHLEERYKGIRSPHKFKGGVSGCVRECAEAQSKDFGLIATDKGWNSTCSPLHYKPTNLNLHQSSSPEMVDRIRDMQHCLLKMFLHQRLSRSLIVF